MSLNLPPEYFQIKNNNTCLNSNLIPDTCNFKTNIFKTATVANPKEFIIVNESQTMCIRENALKPINSRCRVFNSENLKEGKMDFNYLTQTVDGLLKPEGFIKYNYKDEGEKIKPYVANESGIHIHQLSEKDDTSYTQLNVKPSNVKYELGSLLQN